MKKIVLIFLTCFYINANAQQENKEYKFAKAMGEKMVILLKDQNYDKFILFFNDTLNEKLPVFLFQKTIEQLTDKYGPISKPLEFTKRVTAENTYFEQGVQLEKEKFDLVFLLNVNNQVTGFRITPYRNKSKWEAPNYISDFDFQEYPIKIGDVKPLLGSYTKPDRAAKSIIVVLVHGSGPNDMDESLGPNKIFKDLALGLAENGIATIRYNKRTYDYKHQMAKNINSLTIDNVVTDDAVKAIAKAKELGAEKIILLGHSLGGHMAPKIASIANVDGVVLLAGNVSPIEELILPQLDYIMKNDSTTSITEIQYNQIKWQIENLEKGDIDSSTAAPTLPLGLPASFWNSLKSYQPQKISKKQDIPYLVLNGDRDYQVTVVEAEKWKSGNKNEKSKTIIYPKLNHLFYAGEGILLPAEYEKTGHFDENVLNDMIQWINAL